MIRGNEYMMAHPDTINLINIDIKDNYLVWLFPRTGSKLFFKIFKDTDFKCFSYQEDNLKLVRSDLIHHHWFTMFPNIDKYKLILTVRNPYSLLAALYYMSSKVPEMENLKEVFGEFLEISLYTNPNIKELLYNLNHVQVSHYLRIENLLRDYTSLPIIRKSKIYQENNLESLINSKVNKSESPLAKLNYRDFYNQKNADMVYYLFSNYFNIFGYDKNSWK